MGMIEDEIIHWWNGEDGKKHKTTLRLERENSSEYNSFPRDGTVTIRVANTIGHAAIKLSPDEALRVSTQLLAVAKELLNQKRELWNKREE